jgi:predicted enzyme related to lactoylglutathione lyase
MAPPSAAMARALSARIPQLAVPESLIEALGSSRNAGADFACAMGRHGRRRPVAGHTLFMSDGLLQKVDAVTFNVPNLDVGLAFYVDRLGHTVNWRNDEIGQAGLRLPDSDTEIVLTTEHSYEPNWLVESVDHAVHDFVGAGGTVLAEPFDIPVGRVAVVSDPFGNVLVLVDLSAGLYDTDEAGNVTGVTRDA